MIEMIITCFIIWWVVGFIYLVIDLYRCQQQGMNITIRDIILLFPCSIVGPFMLLDDIICKFPDLWNFTLVKGKDSDKKTSN